MKPLLSKVNRRAEFSIPEFRPLGDTKSLARYVTPLASGDIMRQGFPVTEGLIFWYVSLEAMWQLQKTIYQINEIVKVSWSQNCCIKGCGI